MQVQFEKYWIRGHGNKTVQKGRLQPVPEGSWLLGEIWVRPGPGRLWEPLQTFKAGSVWFTFVIHRDSSRGRHCFGVWPWVGSLVSEVQIEDKLDPIAGLL